MYETQLYPDHIYTFKHALTHEVAYSSLLKERRRTLHTRIFDVLEKLADDHLAEQVEPLAYHAFRGEVWDKALIYYRLAGSKSMARSASNEAVLCFEQALEALHHLPERRDLQEQAIDLRLDLRNARIVLGDLQGILNDLREAEQMAEDLDDSQRLGRVLLYMALNFMATGEYDSAAVFGQRVRVLAMSGDDIHFQAQSNSYLSAIYGAQGAYARAREHGDILPGEIQDLGQGAYARAREHGRQAMALFTGDLRYERFGEASFPAVLYRYVLCACLAEMGGFEEGILTGEDGLHIAEMVNHPTSQMLASMGIGFVYLRQGEVSLAVPLLERAVSICREDDRRFYLSTAGERLAAAYLLNGQITEALSLSEEIVAQLTSLEVMVRQSMCVARLGEAYLHAGNLAEATVRAKQALELSRMQKECGCEAHILRLLGEIAASHNPPDVGAAEARYQQTLALATELDMSPLIAHSHCGLGTLYREVGKAVPARSELSAAVSMYRDMEMRFWLPETEAALAEAERR